MEHGASHTGGELGEDDLSIEIQVLLIIGQHGAGFGGEQPVIDVGRAGHAAIGINLAGEFQGFGLNAVHIFTGQGNFEGQAVGDFRAQGHAHPVEPGLDGGEHVFHVHIRHGLIQVVDELFEEGFILADVEIGGSGGHHHGFLLEYQRQGGRKVVAPAGLEFVHEIIAPQLAAVGVGGQLQRVHV